MKCLARLSEEIRVLLSCCSKFTLQEGGVMMWGWIDPGALNMFDHSE